MAHAVFTLEDSKEARTELSLLLQIESSQLSVLSHNGLITVEFPDLAEVTALQVLSRAVSNHGFVVDMTKPSKLSRKTLAHVEYEQKPEQKTKAPLEVEKLVKIAKGTESANKGKV